MSCNEKRQPLFASASLFRSLEKVVTGLSTLKVEPFEADGITPLLRSGLGITVIIVIKCLRVHREIGHCTRNTKDYNLSWCPASRALGLTDWSWQWLEALQWDSVTQGLRLYSVLAAGLLNVFRNVQWTELGAW